MIRRFLKGDQICGLIWFFLGIALCLGSVRLNLGEFHRPGPGFMPFLSGALLGLFGLLLTFADIFQRSWEEKKAEIREVLLKKNARQLLYTFSILLAYGLLFEPLGFFVATFLFFFTLFKLKSPKRWLMPLIISGSSVIVSYLIFCVWLKCQLPRGIFQP